MSGTVLEQLTSDGPAAGAQDVGSPVSSLPVYVHQADVPVINPPAGLTGLPERGIALTSDVPDQVFALIRLQAERADQDEFSFVTATGSPKSDPPNYQVRFRNRSTFWRYRRKATGAIDLTTTTALPLTAFGNAGPKQKPEPGHLRAEMIGTTRVGRLVSDVYV